MFWRQLSIWTGVIAVLGIVILFGGCSPAQKAAVQAGLDEAKGANDTVAQGLKQAPCAMSVGASHRILTERERQAVSVLCGGPEPQFLTRDDLMRALGAL